MRAGLSALFVLLTCTLVTSACDDARDSAHDPIVTDSAGIRVVHNTSSGLGDGRAWRVSAAPRVAIGAVHGDSAYLFDRIVGVQRLSDGRWAVADMGSSQVRFYDADGRHLHSVGRKGEGPGEFRQVMGLLALHGDRLMVDDSYVRTQVLDGAGNLLDVLPTAANLAAARLALAGSFADGTLVAEALPAAPQQATEPVWMTRSYVRARIARDDAGGAELAVLDTIGTWNLLRLVPGWNGRAQVVQFEVQLQMALSSEGVVVADPTSYEIRVYGADGSLRTIARRDWSPVPVTDAHREARRAAHMNMGAEGGGAVPDRLRRQREEIMEAWQFASHLPAFSALHIDAADNIWLKDYVVNEATVGTWRPAPTSPGRWTVFSPDGVLLSGVELPARFAPLVFGEEYIAGIYRDDVDVEHVHVYALNRR